MHALVKLLPIPKSQPSLKLAILLLLASDESLNPGPSTCSTGEISNIKCKINKNKAALLAVMVSSRQVDILAIMPI